VSLLKRVLVGRPLPSADEERRRIPKIVGLAVFSSDAISSTAYATEEILHVLVARAGMEALEYLIPISLVVVVLLAIVGLSYRQTIFAYPSGGGSYTVSRENLGTGPSLVAAGSMLTDYILTVAVSISAGVAAITSAVPELRGHRIDLGLVLIALITLANLRGLKEAGTIFAGPTYVYVLSLGALIVWGLFRSFTGDLDPLPVNEGNLAKFTPESGVLAGVTAFALMRAFSSGAVALTGVEAISIAVPTF
jgi:amino acid transporter